MATITVGQENNTGTEIYYEDHGADLIHDVQVTVVEGGPHAIPWTHAGQVNAALLDFLRR
jgi:pimeloyl-ACP methyl ester carboxylesterase